MGQNGADENTTIEDRIGRLLHGVVAAGLLEQVETSLELQLELYRRRYTGAVQLNCKDGLISDFWVTSMERIKVKRTA